MPMEGAMHNPYELTRNAQENFGTVLMFAFGRDAIGAVINERFQGGWKFLNKLVYETSERRADRALLEMAVQLRALDDLNDLNGEFQQLKSPALGKVVQGDGSTTELYFRDMTNKIMHAAGFSWELADPKAPTIVCLSINGERWKEAHISLVRLMHYMGGLMY
jgi:hypothetical protein